MKAIKQSIRAATGGTIHLLFDLWSSKSKWSVLGIKIQYIQNGELKTRIVGFKHFSQSHTGENIRETIVKLLKEDLGLNQDQVSWLIAISFILFPNHFSFLFCR